MEVHTLSPAGGCAPKAWRPAMERGLSGSAGSPPLEARDRVRPMELKATRYAVSDGISVVTLSRPKRRNAWTGRMHTEYRWILREADRDPAVRVIVVTGDPEGLTFCPGADFQALEGHSERGGYDPGTPDDIAEPGY